MRAPEYFESDPVPIREGNGGVVPKRQLPRWQFGRGYVPDWHKMELYTQEGVVFRIRGELEFWVFRFSFIFNKTGSGGLNLGVYRYLRKTRNPNYEFASS